MNRNDLAGYFAGLPFLSQTLTDCKMIVLPSCPTTTSARLIF